ncbi:MAG: flavodoxin domain-containing protein [Deinococcales bacterium]
MASVLIVHASREGQTMRIAERLADTLRQGGNEVRLAAAEPFPGVGGVDGVIVAASVHLGRHPRSLARAVRAHRTVLEHLPSAFLSVCLAAACGDPLHRAEADGYLDDFVRRTGWQPDMAASVAGALRFSRYGYLKARFVRAMSRRERLTSELGVDREFTDWNEVRRFAEAFGALLGSIPRPRFERTPPTLT